MHCVNEFLVSRVVVVPDGLHSLKLTLFPKNAGKWEAFSFPFGTNKANISGAMLVRFRVSCTFILLWVFLESSFVFSEGDII